MKNPRKDIEMKVKEELVDLLYKRFHLILLGEFLAAIIYVVILWNVVNHALLASWLTLNIAVNGVMRHILVFFYHHKKSLFSVEQWNMLFVTAAFFAGVVWGIGSLLFLVVQDDFHRIVVVLILVGLASASSAVYLPSRKACLMNVLPIYFSMFILLALQRNLIVFSLSIALVVLVVLTTKLSFSSSVALASSLWQKFRNEELLQKLFLANKELEIRNQTIQQEIDLRKGVEETLNDLAIHDPLTQLVNRYYLYSRLEEIFSHSQKLSALLLLDLDGFKKVNDTLGHDAGDELLIQVARRITSSLREHDIIARLGGDEFCIFVEDIDTLDAIDRIAHQLCHALSQPFFIQQTEVTISASLGISLYPQDGQNMMTLLKCADIALYQAKDQGKNTYQYFSKG